jgi:hypothetical protein
LHGFGIFKQIMSFLQSSHFAGPLKPNQNSKYFLNPPAREIDKGHLGDNNGAMPKFGSPGRILRMHPPHPLVGVSRFAQFEPDEQKAVAPRQVDLFCTPADEVSARRLIERLLAVSADFSNAAWLLESHVDRGSPVEVSLDSCDCLLLFCGSTPFSSALLAEIENHARRGGAIVAMRVGTPQSPEWHEFARHILGVTLGNSMPASDMILRVAAGCYFHPVMQRVSAWEAEIAHTAALDPRMKPFIEGICGGNRQTLAWGLDSGQTRLFATRLGDPRDIEQTSCIRLLWNALHWTQNQD